MKWFAIAGFAAAVLGAGIWLGHTTSATAEVEHAAPHRTDPAPTQHAPRAVARPAVAVHAAPATPGLAADLADRDPKVRLAALAEIVKAGDADPKLLLSASRDPDLGVAVYATTSLAKPYASGDVPIGEMIDRVTDHALPERVRVAAANGLGVVAAPEAAKLLAELAVRGDTVERRMAVILLQHQDPELAMPALLDALGDTDEDVRANALESLRARSRGRDFGSDAAAWRAWWQARPRN